jgi:hypothetical protein
MLNGGTTCGPLNESSFRLCICIFSGKFQVQSKNLARAHFLSEAAGLNDGVVAVPLLPDSF